MASPEQKILLADSSPQSSDCGPSPGEPIDYQTPDLDRALKDAYPGGIDVDYDNVGGPVLEAVLRRINRGAPIPLVGLIAQSNAAEPPPGPTRCRCRSSGR